MSLVFRWFGVGEYVFRNSLFKDIKVWGDIIYLEILENSMFLVNDVGEGVKWVS